MLQTTRTFKVVSFLSKSLINIPVFTLCHLEVQRVRSKHQTRVWFYTDIINHSFGTSVVLLRYLGTLAPVAAATRLKDFSSFPFFLSFTSRSTCVWISLSHTQTHKHTHACIMFKDNIMCVCAKLFQQNRSSSCSRCVCVSVCVCVCWCVVYRA